MNWYVLKVKSKWEFKVYNALIERGVETYCPSYIEVRQWSDRRKKVRRPYFNGYVFVRLQETERDQVFGIQGIVRYVFWQGKAARVQEAEISLMKSYLDRGTLVDIRLDQLAIGDQVQFGSGAFKGRKAYVEEKGKNGVRLVLPMLGYRITAHMADLVV